jgi:hypothetical protein
LYWKFPEKSRKLIIIFDLKVAISLSIEKWKKINEFRLRKKLTVILGDSCCLKLFVRLLEFARVFIMGIAVRNFHGLG